MPLLGVFDEVLQGFGIARGQILPVVLLVLIPLIAIVVFGALQIRRAREEAVRRAASAYRQALARKKLEPREAQIVETLAQHLRDQRRRHEILTNPQVFQKAVTEAIRAGALRDEESAALRVRLGFAARDPERAINSTAELAKDIPLIIVQERVRKLRGRTGEVTPSHLGIVTEDGEIPPAVGSQLQVYFKRETGVFTFSSRVLSLEGSVARIAHTERINRYQKRKYYRRRISLPVAVRVAGSEEKALEYRFLDLGGGGASITNPDLRFRPGDDVEMAFRAGSEGTIELLGEVIRLSDAGRVMHLQFGPMREAMRDRIIGFILNAGKKKD